MDASNPQRITSYDKQTIPRFQPAAFFYFGGIKHEEDHGEGISDIGICKDRGTDTSDEFGVPTSAKMKTQAPPPTKIDTNGRGLQCAFYNGGFECKKGVRCQYIHDNKKRAINMQRSRERALQSLQQDEAERDANSSEEPQHAVLLSGFGRWYNEGDIRIKSKFFGFNPLRFEWGALFSHEEHTYLREKYKLPELFVRVLFENKEMARTVIIKRNGSRIGPVNKKNGLRLIVQSYIPRSVGELEPRNGCILKQATVDDSGTVEDVRVDEELKR